MHTGRNGALKSKRIPNVYKNESKTVCTNPLPVLTQCNARHSFIPPFPLQTFNIKHMHRTYGCCYVHKWKFFVSKLLKRINVMWSKHRYPLMQEKVSKHITHTREMCASPSSIFRCASCIFIYLFFALDQFNIKMFSPFVSGAFSNIWALFFCSIHRGLRGLCITCISSSIAVSVYFNFYFQLLRSFIIINIIFFFEMAMHANCVKHLGHPGFNGYFRISVYNVHKANTFLNGFPFITQKKKKKTPPEAISNRNRLRINH